VLRTDREGLGGGEFTSVKFEQYYTSMGLNGTSPFPIHHSKMGSWSGTIKPSSPWQDEC
jgi:hypothetical protein